MYLQKKKIPVKKVVHGTVTIMKQDQKENDFFKISETEHDKNKLRLF